MKVLGAPPLRVASGPPATVEVDTRRDWTVRLGVVERIARWGGLRLYVPPGWTVPQMADPAREGYVSVSVESRALTRAYLHTGRWITVLVTDGALAPGDAVEIRYGGAAGASAPRVSGEVSEFTVSVDVQGHGNYREVEGSPRVTTVAAPASALEISPPSTARPGEPIPTRIKAVDGLGNLAPAELDLQLVLASDDLREPATSRVSAVNAAGVVHLAAPRPGVWWVEARDQRSGASGRSPAIVVRDDLDLRVFWGDIHGHSVLSDGALSPEEYYRFARDVSGLDFAALTDHDDVGHNSNVPDHSHFLTQAEWERIQAVTNAFNDPGRFVTLVGFEYTQIELGVEGHRNVYYRGSAEPLLSARDPRSNRPTKLFEQLAHVDALVIPHHALHYMSWEHDPRLQRLFEIYSMWGVSEDASGDCAFTGKMVSAGSGMSYQDALARGYRLGVTAGGDNHDSRPGRRGSTDRWRKGRMAQPPGLVAVRAATLSREAIFDALWARRCYATTGERIFVDYRLNGRHMGEELELDRPDGERWITLTVVGESPLERVDLLKENAVVASWRPTGRSVEVEWKDAHPLAGMSSFYYVRARQIDGARAWTTPIWVDVRRA